MSKAKFKGILAIGRTAADARNQYKLLALGKGAAVQVSGEGYAFVTHSSGENMFNPHSGDMDLEVDAAALAELEFQSNSSEVPDSAYHFKCQSGCGAHIFTDDKEIHFCPNCTSEAVAADEQEDEGSDAEAGSDTEGSDAEEGSDAGSDTEGSDADVTSDADDGSDQDLAVVSANLSDDDLAVVSHSFDDALRIYNENKVGVALAADHSVEYVVCSNEQCGGHIVSDVALSACPACNSDVVEPQSEANAGDECSDEDEGQDETDSDAEVSSAEDDESVSTGSESDAGGATESESDAESDADAESDQDAGSESDAESDAEATASDEDGDIAVVAASRDEAEQMFAEQMIGVVTASEVEAHYVVCSNAACGMHIIGTKAVQDCPVCQSSAEEPEDSDAEATAGSESDGDEGLSITDNEGNSLDEKTSDVDAAAEVDESAEAKDLDVSYSTVQGEATWTAFYKGLPIALAKRVDAGKNVDVFDKPSFGQVVIATAGHSGVMPALKELGFKTIKHKVSVSREVGRMVEAQVGEALASAEASKKEFKDHFLAALATAAAGINRNFFKDVAANPLKSSIWTALNGAGMQNPEALIDKAFSAHADEYHKILVAKACEILEKPSEVQVSLASAVQGANYQVVASGGNIEDRLAGLGTSVSSDNGDKTSAEPTVAVASAGDLDAIHKAVLTLGRRR